MKLTVVFTKCDKDRELPSGRGEKATDFKNAIDAATGKTLSFFETCAESEDVLLDFEDLMAWSAEALPNEQMRASFIAAQKISIEGKRKAAIAIVAAATATTAATAGLNPLPVADTILIVPQQLAMAVSLGKLFMFGSITEAAGNVLKTQIASIAGKAVAANFLKLIPIAGQVINAAVAGAITYGLGMALTEAYANAYEEYLDTGELPDWTAVFSSDAFMNTLAKFFKDFRKKKGEI